jgi:hypothetical protein
LNGSAFLAWLAAAALLFALGSRINAALGWGGGGGLRRSVFAFLSGALALHLLWTALDLAGIRVSAAVVLVGLSAGIAGSFALRRRAPRVALPSDLGWGDGLAVAAWMAFGLLSASLWIATPDFVYHWGLKGDRFFLTGGVDYAYLARPWNWSLHPDYPNLFPELLASTALLARRFDPPSLMGWTTLAFGLLLAACRELTARMAGDAADSALRFVRQAGTALVALVSAAFALGHQMAGAADWLIALALAAAAPALLRPPDRDGDLEIGLAAAFAAASKIEGIPLALLLLAVQWMRRLPLWRKSRPEWPQLGKEIHAALLLGLPALLVVFPWWIQARRFGLFQAFDSGTFQAARGAFIAPALRTALETPAWHGFILAAFAPPLLLLAGLLPGARRLRSARPFALVATAQLAFYFFVYFTAPVDTGYYVLSSFPRLALQLVPAVLAVMVGMTAGEARRPAG